VIPGTAAFRGLLPFGGGSLLSSSGSLPSRGLFSSGDSIQSEGRETEHYSNRRSKVELRRVVAVSTEACWTTVADINNYTKWMPWCSTAYILPLRIQKGPGINTGGLGVPSSASSDLFSSSLGSDSQKDSFECVIDISLSEFGLPFGEEVQHRVDLVPGRRVTATSVRSANAELLQFDWRFAPVEGKCRLTGEIREGTEVCLTTNVVFKSFAYSVLWSQIANFVSSSILDGFERRAETIERKHRPGTVPIRRYSTGSMHR